LFTSIFISLLCIDESEVSDPTILTSLLDSVVIGGTNGYSNFRIGTHIDDADADFSSDSEDDDDLQEEDDDQDVCPQSVADAQSSFEKSEEERKRGKDHAWYCWQLEFPSLPV
jgi:hypothetical protein